MDVTIIINKLWSISDFFLVYLMPNIGVFPKRILAISFQNHLIFSRLEFVVY